MMYLYQEIPRRVTVWVEFYGPDVIVTKGVNIDVPDEDPEDSRSVFYKLSFSLSGAKKAFGVKYSSQVRDLFVQYYSQKEAVKLISDFLLEHKVHFRIEEYWDDPMTREDEDQPTRVWTDEAPSPDQTAYFFEE